MVVSQNDAPIPRFSGFVILDDYPGDFPLGGNPIPVGRRAPPSHSGSTSEDSRHYVPAQAQNDINRHCAATERYHIDDRQDRRPRYDGRAPYTRGPTAEREHQRFNDYSIYEDDRIRACETARERERVSSSDGDSQDRPSPWAVSQNGEAPPEDEFVCPPPDPDYPQQEEARIGRAKEKTHRERRDKQPPVWRGQDPYMLGRWDRCKIQTLEQAYNLVAFLDIGQEQAYELFTITVQNMGNFPLQFRTEGEAHLMRHQQELEKRWWICTTGAPRPPRYEDIPAEMQHASASNSRPYGPNARSAFGSIVPPRPAGPGTAPRVPLPAAVPTTAATLNSDQRPVAYTDAASAQGYLGRSPPNPLDVAPVSAENEFPVLDLVPNTKWSAGELNNRYWCTPPSRWGLGLRSVLLRIALNAGNTPWHNDVLSFHTMIALSPPDPIRFAQQYHLFFDVAVCLFSITGLYEHLVRLGEYEVASVPMQHYPYLTDGITIFLIVAGLAQHGIVPGSRDVSAIENFCRSRRNMEAGIENTSWIDEPQGAETALQITSASVPHWSELDYGDRRPEAIDLSTAVPMTGVIGAGGAELLDVHPPLPSA
ncbi:hypothetical protein B0H17DRAFT_1222148 [Mycena rosella]|uniref:Uncharacterized protein n=1 Tax=Mycena rosella TaxID=1033263 RepID=A0AAD7AYR9_MYCRO|nr:hypothetical protein B0H17DRAFT_1222148 [Mycena rosella]